MLVKLLSGATAARKYRRQSVQWPIDNPYCSFFSLSSYLSLAAVVCALCQFFCGIFVFIVNIYCVFPSLPLFTLVHPPTEA